MLLRPGRARSGDFCSNLPVSAQGLKWPNVASGATAGSRREPRQRNCKRHPPPPRLRRTGRRLRRLVRHNGSHRTLKIFLNKVTIKKTNADQSMTSAKIKGKPKPGGMDKCSIVQVSG